MTSPRSCWTWFDLGTPLAAMRGGGGRAENYKEQSSIRSLRSERCGIAAHGMITILSGHKNQNKLAGPSTTIQAGIL